MIETGIAEHDQLMRDYLGVWNDEEYSKLSDLVAESVTVYDPGVPGGVIHGRDELEALIRETRAGFSDFEVTIDDVLAGDDVVMGEWTFTGTHDGEFNGIAPTGREVDVTGMDKFLIADGKVQEHRIYYDLQGMFEQLGLTEV